MQYSSVGFNPLERQNLKNPPSEKRECKGPFADSFGGIESPIHGATPKLSRPGGRLICRIWLACLFLFLFPAICIAGQVTLQWAPNTTPPDGYVVFQRMDGAQYDYDSPAWPLDGQDHKETTCTIQGLTEGITYHFVVRAHVGGNHSGNSNEATNRVPTNQSASHTISVSSGSNGTIWPPGPDVNVDHEETKTFYFTPNTGYEIGDVRIDGQSVGTPSSYTFGNIVNDHSIAVTYSIVPSASQNQSTSTGYLIDPKSMVSQSPDEVKIWLEAEDGNVDWPTVIADDPKASEGTYIHAPANSTTWNAISGGSSGGSEHIIDAPSTGDYLVWARVIANNARSGSFHVTMDGRNYLSWQVSQTAQDTWAWDMVGEYHLEPGSHKLSIAPREAGARIDCILVTDSSNFVPSEASEPSNAGEPPNADEPNSSSTISKDDWQLVSVDSENLVYADGAGANAFDGDPDTAWYSTWRFTDSNRTHEIIIDLGHTYQLDGFTVLPRQNGISGRIIDYEFYVSDQADQWSQPVSAGQFTENANEKSIAFNATNGRYIKLVALSSANQTNWTSVAEIGLRGMLLNDTAAPDNSHVQWAMDNRIPDKTDWQLVYADSEDLVYGDGAAVNAFDGDPDTVWYSTWRFTNSNRTHEIIIDLGDTCQLAGFTMLPRQNGTSGRIIDYQFYVSQQPDQWSQPVAAGRFAENADEKSVAFSAITGRYIKLVVLSSANQTNWTSLAEINVTGN